MDRASGGGSGHRMFITYNLHPDITPILLIRLEPTGHPMYPRLPRSFKKTFPFKLCTPSFIYPDDYIPNIRLLGTCLDEIEILCFESDALPSSRSIQEMAALATDMDLTYNVHLPTDINPGSLEPNVRNHFIETMLRVMERVQPLRASTHTLHLPYLQTPVRGKCDMSWIDRTADTLHKLLKTGIKGSCLSIETLDYPLEWLAPVLDVFHLQVCLDLGHLMIHQEDITATYDHFENRTALIHLHGVQNGKDHLGLDVLDPNPQKGICSILNRFSGTVSIEVFSYMHLMSSLTVLETWFKR